MNKILAAIVVGLNLIIIFVSVLIYNNDFQHKLDIRSFYQTANRVDNKSDFDYLLKTGSGHSIIQTKLSAIDSVTLPQITSGKRFMALTVRYQKYQPHTEVYTTTDGKGHVHTHIRTVWRWDTVGEDSEISKSLKFFNSKYSTNLFAIDKYKKDIPLNQLFSGSKDTDNIQSTGLNRRTIWEGVPDEIKTTFYADLSAKGLMPIKFPNESRDERIRLHTNQPINVFLNNELQANTPHPIIWGTVTFLIMILSSVLIVWLIMFVDL
jgi:hypothetical protein